MMREDYFAKKCGLETRSFSISSWISARINLSIFRNRTLVIGGPLYLTSLSVKVIDSSNGRNFRVFDFIKLKKQFLIVMKNDYDLFFFASAIAAKSLVLSTGFALAFSSAQTSSAFRPSKGIGDVFGRVEKIF